MGLEIQGLKQENKILKEKLQKAETETAKTKETSPGKAVKEDLQEAETETSKTKETLPEKALASAQMAVANDMNSIENGSIVSEKKAATKGRWRRSVNSRRLTKMNDGEIKPAAKKHQNESQMMLMVFWCQRLQRKLPYPNPENQESLGVPEK